ncbi:hypothetical protein V9T40_012944 [Parthenolecanium corni]|uniref:Uncharacterized protein n=1 Tax=Parthenolecanium corni TaxID=536013 RepID=A0AAN9T845_9HEMI
MGLTGRCHRYKLEITKLSYKHNSGFVVCLAFTSALAAPAQEEQKNVRDKRFYPFSAYSAIAPAVSPLVTSHSYSYLAPYANSGKIVNYPAPVVAAAPAVVSTYHAPVVSTYHAPVVSTYAAAVPAISTYHAPISTYAAAVPAISAYHY